MWNTVVWYDLGGLRWVTHPVGSASMTVSHTCGEGVPQRVAAVGSLDAGAQEPDAVGDVVRQRRRVGGAFIDGVLGRGCLD